jgi:hypothetical protein
VTDALLIVVLAGLSEAIGQSVVLFANRVSPARFIACLFMNALLVAAGFASLVLFTWASFFVPGSRPVAFPLLTIAVGLSYAPLMFSFLAALPYAGNALMWGLRVAQLVAMVLGVSAAAHISPWLSAAHVAAGWAVKLGLRQAFSKPFAMAQSFLTNLAAGKTLIGESAAVRRVARDLIGPARTSADRGAPATTHRRGQSLFTGIVITLISVVAILVALTPLRVAVAHTYASLLFLRAGFDLIWVAVAAVVIAAFLAPLETLGWWAGWYGDDVDAGHPAARHTPESAQPAAEPERYIVYLDGISQSSAAYTPDIETFLDALEPELPAGTVLIRGIMAYSVLNRPLDDDPMYARFWSWVELLRGRTRTAILGMFINIRNVMIVAVSADARYGPLYNLGIAQVVFNQLVQRGYRPKSGIPITMIGYSGGGQMCAETGPLLRHAFGAPLEVISLAGVMTGTCPFLHIDRLHHMYGAKDVIEPLGPIMFSSRWPILKHSKWNRALRRGRISIAHLGPVGHQVPGGLLDPAYTMPDGRSALRHTLDQIHAILESAPTR